MADTPLAALMKALPSFGECALITSDTDRRYFTKMKSSAGTLAVFRDKAYLIIDFRYIEKARKSAVGCEVLLQTDLYAQINELAKRHGVKRISVCSRQITVSALEEMKNRLDCEIDSSCALSDAVDEIRICKREEEIQCIIAAQRIAEKAFEHILGFISAGVSERDIALELDFFMLKNGAEALSFDTIALSGKNTSLPHGVPSDKTVSNGEFVLMDYGAVVEGWHSDMTRTVCVGEPDEEMKKVYGIVLDAQKAALDAVRAGITGAQLDETARRIIADAGYGGNFGHSLGHGVGMEIHESPAASPKGKTVLRENMIVTVEPGIYIPDRFGVRIEDFVVVKENGCENMTRAAKELIAL